MFENVGIFVPKEMLINMKTEKRCCVLKDNCCIWAIKTVWWSYTYECNQNFCSSKQVKSLLISIVLNGLLVRFSSTTKHSFDKDDENEPDRVSLSLKCMTENFILFWQIQCKSYFSPIPDLCCYVLKELFCALSWSYGHTREFGEHFRS